MPDVTPVPHELSRSLGVLARALMAASRSWTLYPREHPAVRSSLDSLVRTIAGICGESTFSFGVTPETLLVKGAPAPSGDGPIAETAAWLHQRDVVQLTFRSSVPAPALEALLSLLAETPAAVRARGGPARVWQEQGHPSIVIEQIDFTHVLEDRQTENSVRTKDDLWRAIVRAVLDRRKGLDEASQARLLDIAGDAFAISDLAQDVMAPNCTPDGSPLLTTQAAAVVAAYQHLAGIVDVMAPDRRPELVRNLASATAGLDPRVVMQILEADNEQAQSGSGELGRAVAGAMDDAQVAQLLATTLAIDGRATDRIAAVFNTIAPDDDRRRRVLTMTHGLLSESAFGRAGSFDDLWSSMEELLLSYNERPFVSAQYGDGLDQIAGRAEAMAAGEIPAELAELITTLDQDNVRRLSVVLLIDLLAFERVPARATELARDIAALGEDLLLAGDYAGARSVAKALAMHAADAASPASSGGRIALDALVNSAAFHEAVENLADMDPAAAADFSELCAAVGPAATDALHRALDVEPPSLVLERAAAILRQFGPPAVKRLAPLVSSRHWYARVNAAAVMGDIASADAVPLLQPLLRGGDPRVIRAAVKALSRIDDPSAARSVHTALRASAGELRQAVVSALVAERDPRAVPLLARILDESDAFGVDHEVVIEALGAVGMLGNDGAIPAVDRVMRKTRWFARPKLRAVKSASVRALRQIGSPAATATIARAASTGDRLLKQAALETRGAR